LLIAAQEIIGQPSEASSHIHSNVTFQQP